MNPLMQVSGKIGDLITTLDRFEARGGHLYSHFAQTFSRLVSLQYTTLISPWGSSLGSNMSLAKHRTSHKYNILEHTVGEKASQWIISLSLDTCFPAIWCIISLLLAASFPCHWTLCFFTATCWVFHTHSGCRWSYSSSWCAVLLSHNPNPNFR